MKGVLLSGNFLLSSVEVNFENYFQLSLPINVLWYRGASTSSTMEGNTEPEQDGSPLQLSAIPRVERSPAAGSKDQLSVESEASYTSFNVQEKLILVVLATAASGISSLTANIYYPAILDLSNEFGVSRNLINLTITVYLIFQGLAPTFISSIQTPLVDVQVI